MLLIKTGTTVEPLLQGGEDFEHWFAAGLGMELSQLTVVHVYKDEPLPDPARVNSALITGSPAMVSDRLPWSERTARWLRRAAQQRTALLGVCFGHQLLAHAFGGEVGKNPEGLRMGTAEVELLDQGAKDLLLGGLSPQLPLQVSHEESVLRLPPGATLLASAPHDRHHAFRLNERAWGVQFHPEFDERIIATYIKHRTARLLQAHHDVPGLLSRVRPSPAGPEILRRFRALGR